jgi:hypothetical protein
MLARALDGEAIRDPEEEAYKSEENPRPTLTKRGWGTPAIRKKKERGRVKGFRKCARECRLAVTVGYSAHHIRKNNNWPIGNLQMARI